MAGISTVRTLESLKRLKHGELTDKILRVFYDVYNELGHGFVESVYEEALAIGLESAGLECQRQPEIPVWFRGQAIGRFRADLVVSNSVLLELKVADSLSSAHIGQVLNYLKATDFEVALLLNFGVHPQFKRVVFENSRKKIRNNPRESAVGL